MTDGSLALIDADDLRYATAYRWNTLRRADGGLYASRKIARSARLLMHREMLDVPVGTEVDHINGDGLDNRRSNLRVASHRQNMANTKRRTDNTSGFKGVALDNRNGPVCWRAYIRTGGKQRSLGYHATPEEAARAYDAAARETFGEFARLNFPETKP